MGEYVAAAQAVAAVVGAVSSVSSGMAGSQAASLQAAQLEEERKNAKTQGIVDEQQRRRELANVLATQQAIRAGRGLDLYSETFVNIQDQTRNDAQDDIDAIQLNSLNRQRRFGLGIAQAEAQGRSAIAGGVGGAFTGLGKSAEAGSKIPTGEEKK